MYPKINTHNTLLQQNNKFLSQKILNRFLLSNQNKNFSLKELERIATILYKLTTLCTQIKYKELQNRELHLKEYTHHPLPPQIKSHNLNPNINTIYQNPSTPPPPSTPKTIYQDLPPLPNPNLPQT